MPKDDKCIRSKRANLKIIVIVFLPFSAFFGRIRCTRVDRHLVHRLRCARLPGNRDMWQ